MTSAVFVFQRLARHLQHVVVGSDWSASTLKLRTDFDPATKNQVQHRAGYHSDSNFRSAARDVTDIFVDDVSSDDSVATDQEDNDDDEDDVTTNAVTHAVDDYFDTQSQDVKTSDATLAKLRIPRMNPEQLADALEV